MKYLVPDRIKTKLYKKVGSDYNPGLSYNLKAVIRNVLSFDIQASAGKITVPTLLVYGTDDTSTPTSHGKKLHDLIDGSRLEVVEGADHWLHKKHADRVAKFIEEFID